MIIILTSSSTNYFGFGVEIFTSISNAVSNFLILLLVADTGVGISKCKGQKKGLFTCSGPGPIVETCAMATL